MERVAIKEDFFTTPLEPLDGVRLKGSRCQKCGEAFFGKVPACGNCLSGEIEDLTLSKRGKLFNFTTIWHRPPGDYRGPEPFEPFSIGFVELPEGVRILAPLTGREVDRFTIGADMELVVMPFFKDEKGQEVVIYKFAQVDK